MSHSHGHCCEHEHMAYCKVCQVAHCKDCGKEWPEHVYAPHWWQSVLPPQGPIWTWSTTGNTSDPVGQTATITRTHGHS